MLHHPTLDNLQTLRLRGMYDALIEPMNMPDIDDLSFDERLGLLVDREMTARSDRRLTTRLRPAKFRLSAQIEDVDYRYPRGLDKSLRLQLAACQWVKDRHKLLITGPTGIGKTWSACALGHKACREGYTVLYLRLPRLLQELPMAKADGRYPKLMASLATAELLVLDDWGLAVLSDENRRDVLELLEDRHGRRATLVTSQLPVAHWHEALGDPTLADAILDRLVHNAYTLALKGDAMRNRLAIPKTDATKDELGASKPYITSQPTTGKPPTCQNEPGQGRNRAPEVKPLMSVGAMTSRTKGHAQSHNTPQKEPMMTPHHEQRRKHAIDQYLAGAKIDDICRQMACTKSWLYKWKARYQPDTASWTRERSRRPKNHAAKTPPSIEQAVLARRRTFDQNGQRCGAQAIRQALEQQGITAVPSLRTIYRMLARHAKEDREIAHVLWLTIS